MCLQDLQWIHKGGNNGNDEARRGIDQVRMPLAQNQHRGSEVSSSAPSRAETGSLLGTNDVYPALAPIDDMPKLQPSSSPVQPTQANQAARDAANDNPFAVVNEHAPEQQLQRQTSKRNSSGLEDSPSREFDPRVSGDLAGIASAGISRLRSLSTSMKDQVDSYSAKGTSQGAGRTPRSHGLDSSTSGTMDALLPAMAVCVQAVPGPCMLSVLGNVEFGGLNERLRLCKVQFGRPGS